MTLVDCVSNATLSSKFQHVLQSFCSILCDPLHTAMNPVEGLCHHERLNSIWLASAEMIRHAKSSINFHVTTEDLGQYTSSEFKIVDPFLIEQFNIHVICPQVGALDPAYSSIYHDIVTGRPMTESPLFSSAVATIKLDRFSPCGVNLGEEQHLSQEACDASKSNMEAARDRLLRTLQDKKPDDPLQPACKIHLPHHLEKKFFPANGTNLTPKRECGQNYERCKKIHMTVLSKNPGGVPDSVKKRHKVVVWPALRYAPQYWFLHNFLQLPRLYSFRHRRNHPRKKC